MFIFLYNLLEISSQEDWVNNSLEITFFVTPMHFLFWIVIDFLKEFYDGLTLVWISSEISL